MTQKNPPPIPEGLDLISEGANAVIRYRWFTHTVWAILLFCIAWDSFLVFWYSKALTPKADGTFELMAILFPICHVGVGMGLTYYVLCTFLNQTDVLFSTNELRVSTHPLPWIGDVTLQPSNLTLFSTRMRHSGGRNNTTSFDVMYVDSSNHEKTLIKSLPKEEQAEYIVKVLTMFYLTQK
jgi:hypothetical protein